MTNTDDLIQRAHQRHLFQEAMKQQNIDSVVSNAYIELETKEKVSYNPVNSDWICSFFDFIANISDSNMQLLWGKLLAGEIEKPGRFSMRTLDVLRKLSQKEATIFCKVAPYILRGGSKREGVQGDCFLLNGELLDKHGVEFSDIIALGDAQIVSESQLSLRIILEKASTECIKGEYGKIVLRNIGAPKAEIIHEAYFLTTAGRELLDVALSANNNLCPSGSSYMEDCKKELLQGDITFWGEHKNLADALTIDVFPNTLDNL